jgi:hypothetical protein
VEQTRSDQNYQQQLDREVVEQLNNARYASLTSRAVTDAARRLIDGLIETVEMGEEYRKSRKNKRSEKARYALRRAMEGFVGDLLRAYADEKSGGWVYRSLKANSFSGDQISYRHFLPVLRSLGNFVEMRTGYQAWSDGFDAGGPRLPIRGKATRFRATPLFIDYGKHHGVDVLEIRNHFIQELPKHPLVKRAGSKRDRYGAKVRGNTMRFERTGKAQQLEQQVRELNEFLDRFDLRGGSHRGYLRVFNQGDHPSFDWNKGGRMYSQGDDSYQRMSQDHRLRMTINSEPVCEIDIRASYLTIYHAHYGVPLDPERDPYQLPGLPAEARDVIKLWFVATFGNNGHLDRWPREIAKEYREEHGRSIGKRYPVKRIREKALEQFPLLEKWGTEDFGWSDLMFIESQAMLGAMSELMSLGIPSLTVHDSLIVPVSKREIAERVLSEHYLKEVGAVPVLRVEYPLPSEPAMRSDWSNWSDELPVSESGGDNHGGNAEPFGVHESEDIEARDQASAEDLSDGWDWPADRERDNDDEDAATREDTDDRGEDDPSLYF